jgi:hypothetical protein
MSTKRLLIAFGCGALLTVGACGGDDSTGAAGDDGGSPVSDGGGGSDATSTDGAADATATDAAGMDAVAMDAGAMDANASDAARDASASDADGATPDAGCVVDVFGDYYLRTDGTAATMITNPHAVVIDSTTGQPLKTLTAIVEQSDHACGLRNDGTVWCWPHSTNGGNANGDLGNGQFNGNQNAYYATQVVTQPADAGAAYLTNVTSISTHSEAPDTEATCAIRGDRTVWCWGFSTAQGSPPDGLFWGTIGTRASVPYAIPIALSAPDGGPAPTIKADQVVVGLRHACYLDTGTVHCWGQNIAGNLGTGDTTFQAYPVQVQTGLGLPATVDTITAGSDYTCAVSGGKVWCWGTNTWKQVGDPFVANQVCNANFCEPVPTPVQQSYPDGGLDQTALVNVTQITGGFGATCVRDTLANIWCWGITNAGVGYQGEATPYVPNSGNAPYTNVAKLSAFGVGSTTGLRYLTANGTLVQGRNVVTPLCP